MTRLHLKDGNWGHNQSKGETSPPTSVFLLFKLAHELIDLISLNASILKKFSELRGVLEGLNKLVDVRIVFEVGGEVGHCLAVDVQLAQYVGKVDILAFLDPKYRKKVSFVVIEKCLDRIQILARILWGKKLRSDYRL